MDLDKNIFNLAYLLLNSNVGQKHVKEIIMSKSKIASCPNSFVENLKREKIKILPLWSKKYPTLLKEVSDSPVFLFLKGDFSLLEKNFVTIVGSRNITQYSEKILSEFFERKNSFPKNICFVSGVANGVDSEVHRLCLKKNLHTIGVIGGGIERVYYRGNSIMYNYLSKYRLIISEFPPGRSFFKGMFPLRNRILAGISRKTFVIQAGERSGAINTASHANNYGRDVFVLPDNIFSKENQGCLKLISQGANLVNNIDDFVESLV